MTRISAVSFKAPRLEIAHNLGDQWYADLELEQGDYSGDEIEPSRIGEERNAALTLQRSVENGSYKLFADTSQRKDDDRNGLGLSRTWQLDVRMNWRPASTGIARAKTAA
jgi:hypothetical protein